MADGGSEVREPLEVTIVGGDRGGAREAEGVDGGGGAVDAAGQRDGGGQRSIEGSAEQFFVCGAGAGAAPAGEGHEAKDVAPVKSVCEEQVLRVKRRWREGGGRVVVEWW